VDVMDSVHPGGSFYLEDQKMSKKVGMYLIILFIGISIGIAGGFSVYHYFFMERFSCCGVFG